MTPFTNAVIEQMRALVAQADAGVPCEVTLCWSGGLMSTIDNPFTLLGVLTHSVNRVSKDIAERATRRIAVPQ